MKRKVLFYLLVLLVILTGCAQSAEEPQDFGYTIVKGHPWKYFTTAEELADAASCAYEGKVVDISFHASVTGTNNRYTVWTVYKVWVIEKYKGDVGWVEYIAAPSGIRDYKVEEQVQALRNAGDEGRVNIAANDEIPVLEIGSTYIFLADEYIQEGPYEGYRSVTSLMQFAVNDDPDLTWIADAITREDIYEYLGVNPLLRSLARIGIGAVVLVSVGAVVFFMIRARKNKKEKFEISEIE